MMKKEDKNYLASRGIDLGSSGVQNQSFTTALSGQEQEIEMIKLVEYLMIS